MADAPGKPRGLGRGLSALMSDIAAEPDTSGQRTAERKVPVENLRPNADQPRRTFGEDALEELAQSIREKGVIQPLIVRPHPTETGQFEIVAGERRWRAAQRAQLHDVPVLVREFDDTEVLEVAIIENVQRSDLNAIDEGAAYKQLIDRFGHTQEKVASALGKSRSHIANLIRLLTLPEAVQSLVTDGKLSAGHARVLVGRDDAVALANEFLRKGLSVREAERRVQTPKDKPKPAPKPAAAKDADTLHLEGELSAALGLKATIDHHAHDQGGRLTLHYRDLAQFDDLLRRLSGH